MHAKPKHDHFTLGAAPSLCITPQSPFYPAFPVDLQKWFAEKEGCQNQPSCAILRNGSLDAAPKLVWECAAGNLLPGTMRDNQVFACVSTLHLCIQMLS